MRIFSAMLIVLFAFHVPFARGESTDACLSVFEQAEVEQTAVAGSPARDVAGAGRLYFHAAPDKRCQLKYLFVIPGDRVEAYAEFGDFTNVIYWNAASGAGTGGWVLTARLKEIEINAAYKTAAR